jgi:hypothetical protein
VTLGALANTRAAKHISQMLALLGRHPKILNPRPSPGFFPSFGKISTDDKRTNGR